MVTRDWDQSSWAVSLRCIQLDRVLFLATSHLTLQSFNHLQRRTMRVFYRGRISEFDVKNYGYNCMGRFLIFVANYDNASVPLPRLTFQPILAIIANNSSNFVPNCLYRLNWLIWSQHQVKKCQTNFLGWRCLKNFYHINLILLSVMRICSGLFSSIFYLYNFNTKAEKVQGLDLFSSFLLFYEIDLTYFSRSLSTKDPFFIIREDIISRHYSYGRNAKDANTFWLRLHLIWNAQTFIFENGTLWIIFIANCKSLRFKCEQYY